VARGESGEVVEVHWLLREVGEPSLTVVPAPGRDWDDLAETLHGVVDAAIPLLRADGAGLMLADEAGVLRWVTASSPAERAFEQAQRDLGEGPCIDAFREGLPVWTIDLRADPRWPRLGPAAASHRIRGVLSAPVLLGDHPAGTCNALTCSPRGWTDADVGAMVAYATVLARLIGSTATARHRGELIAQLQGALDSRVLVEQAKGVLMERKDLDAQAAFDLLRRLARTSSRRLADVARDVIAGREP
jgi:GAF domain-containing protein